jgi:phosphoglycerate dehydrogenase-like enzyme
MVDKVTVLITMTLADDELNEMRLAAPDVVFQDVSGQTPKEIEGAISSADVVVGRGDSSTIPRTALARANRLKWIHSWAAGPDALLFPQLIESPIVITSSVGSGATAMAEHTVMLMLMLNRGVLNWVRAQELHRWERGVHDELRGRTCGIIGLGHTGKDLAIKLKAFHMRVVGMRRSAQPAPFVDELFAREDLTELLRQSDFVVITAPRTADTQDMLGEPEFRHMKSSAYFICQSRGGIANEAALVKALSEGWIAGAGLDAFAEEPLPADSPLWDAPNTIITPHIGAQTATRRRASLEMFIENLKRYLTNQPLLNVVDKRAGY